MFADSVWQSQGSDSHRGWITLASFVVQTLAVATLLVLPLLHTEGLLPMHSIVEPVFSPSLAGGTSDIRRPRNQRSNLANTTLVVPRPTSHEMKLISSEDSQPQLDFRQFGVPGGTSNRWSDNSIINSIANPASNFALPPTPVVQRPRISRMHADQVTVHLTFFLRDLCVPFVSFVVIGFSFSPKKYPRLVPGRVPIDTVCWLAHGTPV